MPIRTLFVDDEEGLLDQAKRFLEKKEEDIAVITTRSAETALEMISEEDFDVIVSDYYMPDMDGIEFLKKWNIQWS